MPKVTARAGKGFELPSTLSIDAVYTGSDADWDGTPGVGGNDQWKQPCRVATTASITIATALNSGDTLDGVTLATGDRVLVKDQSSPAQNGIYVVGATPARAVDMDESDEIVGTAVYVIAGTVNAATAWACTNTTAPTIGTDPITFQGFGAGGSGPFETKIEGGQSTIKAHGSAGATETIDPTDGNVHTLTLTANCTITLNAPVGSGAATLEVYALQDGTGGWDITWPGSVVWPGGVDPVPDTTPDTLARYVLETLDGGTTWYGVMVGGSTGTDLSAIDFLVGTASGDLSSEIVVGTTPGGELGGTWGSPTVDTTHSGSSHAATQAAAEATAAAALAAHVAASGADHAHVMDILMSGDASTTAFELPAAPFDAYSVAAYVSGVLTEVTLSGSLLTTATFGAAPASASNNIRFDIVAAVA